MTVQKKPSSTAGVHEHLIEAWLDKWGADDIRHEVFKRFGVVVRQPCVARILVEAGRLDRLTGWRNTTAFALMSSLMRDMPHPTAASVLRAWSAGLGMPIEDSKLEGIIRHAEDNADQPRVECNNLDLGSWCIGEEACDWYGENRGTDRTPPKGAKGILHHGIPAGLKPRDLAVYEALCLIEEATCTRAGGTLASACRTVGGILGVSNSAAQDGLNALASFGYIDIVERGDAAKRHATIVSRVFPLPFNLNGERGVQRLSDFDESAKPDEMNADLRSTILGDFREHFTEPPSDLSEAYLRGRGIGLETACTLGLREFTPAMVKKAHTGFAQRYSTAQFKAARLKPTFFASLAHHPLVIPYREAGRYVGVKGRSFANDGDSPRYVNVTGRMPWAYIPTGSLRKQRVMLCEGEMDAISAWQLGYDAVGLTTAKRTPKELAERLRGHLVVIALDADEAGRAGTELADDALSDAGVQHVKFDLGEGDLNSQMCKDAEGLRRRLDQAFDSMTVAQAPKRGPRFRGMFDDVAPSSCPSSMRDMTPAELKACGIDVAPTRDEERKPASIAELGEALREFI